MCKSILSIGSFLFLFLFMLLVSCEHKPAAYDYRSVAVEGWEPGDTLYYHVDTLQVSGIYDFISDCALRPPRPIHTNRYG